MKKRYFFWSMLGIVWVATTSFALLASYVGMMFWSLFCMDFDGNSIRPCDSWPVIFDRAQLIVLLTVVWSAVAYLTYFIVKSWKRKNK